MWFDHLARWYLLTVGEPGEPVSQQHQSSAASISFQHWRIRQHTYVGRTRCGRRPSKRESNHFNLKEYLVGIRGITARVHV